MVMGLRGRSYEAKLKEVGLTTLVERRQRGDMVEVWKCIHQVSKMNPNISTLVGNDQSQHSQYTRHTAKPLNIIHPRAKLEIRKHFFTVRAVAPWNSLPVEVQGAEDITKFKIEYDNFKETCKKN